MNKLGLPQGSNGRSKVSNMPVLKNLKQSVESAKSQHEADLEKVNRLISNLESRLTSYYIYRGENLNSKYLMKELTPEEKRIQETQRNNIRQLREDINKLKEYRQVLALRTIKITVIHLINYLIIINPQKFNIKNKRGNEIIASFVLF